MTNLRISILNIYSSILIKVKGQSILFDPIEIDPDQFRDLKTIVITHEHLDHFDKKLVIDLQKHTGAKVLTTSFVTNQLTGLGGFAIPMKAGDLWEVESDVRIYAANSKHKANQGLTFFVLSSVVNIFHPNDSEYYPELAQLGAQYKPLIIIFVGTSVEKMFAISEVMRPELIVTHEYPGMRRPNLPDVKVISLKKNEWVVYPDGYVEAEISNVDFL